MISNTYGLALLSLASSIFAKTDISGCTTTQVATGIVYYVPGTGEICSILNCGGGGAPPKSDVPGCAAYTGTVPYQPSFLPSFGFSSTQTQAAPSQAVPTSILADTSNSMPSTAPSTLMTGPLSTSTGIADTTATLQTSEAISSSVTGLVYDTSALTSAVTNTATLTSASVSIPTVASATGNAADRNGAREGVIGLLLGAGAAGFALI